MKGACFLLTGRRGLRSGFLGGGRLNPGGGEGRAWGTFCPVTMKGAGSTTSTRAVSSAFTMLTAFSASTTMALGCFSKYLSCVGLGIPVGTVLSGRISFCPVRGFRPNLGGWGLGASGLVRGLLGLLLVRKGIKSKMEDSFSGLFGRKAGLFLRGVPGGLFLRGGPGSLLREGVPGSLLREGGPGSLLREGVPAGREPTNDWAGLLSFGAANWST